MPFQKKPPEIKCALSCNAAPFFEKPAHLFFAPASEARFWASKRRLFASKKRLFASELDTSGVCTFLRLFSVEKAFILQKSGNYGPKTKRQLKTPRGDSRYIFGVDSWTPAAKSDLHEGLRIGIPGHMGYIQPFSPEDWRPQDR